MAYIGVPDDIPPTAFGKNTFRIVSTVLVIEESLNFRKGNLFEFSSCSEKQRVWFFSLQRYEKLLNYSIYIFEINSTWLEVKNSSIHQRIDLFIQKHTERILNLKTHYAKLALNYLKLMDVLRQSGFGVVFLLYQQSTLAKSNRYPRYVDRAKSRNFQGIEHLAPFSKFQYLPLIKLGGLWFR